jgi:hypothetical protein
MRRLWVAFVMVSVIGFGILGWVGTRIYQEAPPIPERVLTADGSVVVPDGDIGRGPTGSTRLASADGRWRREVVPAPGCRWSRLMVIPGEPIDASPARLGPAQATTVAGASDLSSSVPSRARKHRSASSLLGGQRLRHRSSCFSACRSWPDRVLPCSEGRADALLRVL